MPTPFFGVLFDIYPAFENAYSSALGHYLISARHLRIPAPRFWLVFWQLPEVLALHWYFSFCILAYLSVCSDAQIEGDYA
jgi:hypothetical protein